MMSRLRSIEISGLALLAYSEGLRIDVREGILSSLEGDARKIGSAIVHGDGPGISQTHLAAAAQLKDWAKRLKERREVRSERRRASVERG